MMIDASIHLYYIYIFVLYVDENLVTLRKLTLFFLSSTLF